MTSTKITPLFIGQRLGKGLAICALSMTGSLVFAAQNDRAEMELAANTGPLSEFYLPTTDKPAPTKIAGDKKTESEDVGTRKGRAKLVADAGAVHGGSGGKGKSKQAADESNADAETSASAAQASATNETTATEATTPDAAATPAEKAPTATVAAPTAEAASADDTPVTAEAAPAAEVAPKGTPTAETPPAPREAPTLEAAGAEQAAPATETASPDVKANTKKLSSTKANAKKAAPKPAQVAENSKQEAAVAEPAAPDVEATSKEKTAQSRAATDEQTAPPAEAVAATDAAPAATAPAADTSAAPTEQAAAPGDCGSKPTQEAAPTTAAEAPTPVATEVHWTYEGDTGPEHWAELSPKFKACGAGTRQTPIDIESSAIVPVGLEDVQFNYGRVRAKAINNGHTIQFNVDEGNSIQVDGITYNLTQFHFHTPSEHTIDGGSYPMEMHLVHKDAKGNYAVIAVLMEKGDKNPVLNQLWAKLPKSESNTVEVKEPVDLHALLPTDTSSYRYTGSLTTPPCTEGVKWIVLRSTVAVTMKQFAAFKKLFPMNARPLQPINARSVLEDMTSANAQASN